MRETTRRTRPRPWARGMARGAVAAMAMSGMRQFAVGVGAIERTPPEAMLREGVPAVLAAVPEHRRTAFIELAHWCYGAAAGAAFGLVPRRIRHSRAAGPIYGVLSWGLFEVALAPALGLEHARRARPRERLALLIDHVFFGVVIGRTPEADISDPSAEDGETGGGTRPHRHDR